MPVAERDQFVAEIYLPQGTPLEQTALVADSLEKMLKKDERVKSISSFIGTSSPRFHTTYASKMPAKNYAQFIVNTHSNKETVALLDEFTPKYNDYFPNAHVRFKQLDYQEANNPIEVRIQGNNLDELKKVADSLTVKMRTVPGLKWVHSDFEEMLPGTKVDINQTEANRLGITKTIVATNLAMRFDGLPLTTLWEKDYPITVKLKAERDHEAEYGDVENEYIHSIIPGVSVPLRQIADVKPDWTQGKIVRRNGVRTITVQGDVERGVNTNIVFRAVKKIADSHPLPVGTEIQYGGSYETDSEMLPQVTGALLISIFIVFMILVFHFRKPNLALLVLGSASLSIIGAVFGVLIMGKAFGVTSILGIISLIGILVRNGIIMLDYAEELRHQEKKSVLEAAFEAGKRRMRPIFLTSMAASMGVIPMIISNSALWAPMGIVICFGTLTSMVFLVLIMPVSYWLIFRKVDKNKKKVTIQDLVNNGKVKPAILTVVLVLGLSPFLMAQNNYSLEQCKTLAIQNNAQVKNKVLDVNVSEEVKKAAYTKYFPQVEATAMTFRFDKPLLDMKIPGGDLPVYDGNAVNLATATQFAYFPGMNISLLEKGTIGFATATQPVFAGSRITNGNKLASLGIEVSKIQLASTRDEVLIETERQYWKIVELGEKMKTLNDYIQMIDSLHKEVNDVYNAGLIIRNDLLKVELKQNELQINRVQLKNGIILAKMAFCQYIGVLYNPEINFTNNLDQTEPPQLLYTDHKEALLDRADYKLLQKSTEAEKYQTKLQQGEYMPQVGVGVGAQYLDIMNGKGTGYGMVFGSVNIPISGWWEASHKLKERRFKEEQNQNMVTDNTEKLLLQMQLARNTLDEAFKQVQLAESSIAQAEENLKVSHDNYIAGLINVSDLLEAQALLQSSKDKLVNFRGNYQIAKAKYLQVTGKYEQ
jgi:outer membrane protein TolC